MMKISNCRCDDRLIHGQVIFKWLKSLEIDSILIIDDIASSNIVEQGLIKMSAPRDCELSIISVDYAKRYLFEKDSKKILVLIRSLLTLKKLNEDFLIEHLNLGRVPTGVGRKKVCSNIFLNEEDIGIIKDCLGKGTEVIIQMVPDEEAIIVNEQLLEIGIE